MWEHSPTRRKENPLARINRGVNSPINCLCPLSYRTCTWRPTRAPTWPSGLPATWLRPPCVASCHASTPPAPRVGRPGSATWPQCRVAPWVGPARHVSRRLATSAPTGNKTPFFALLLIENPNKNQIKFRKIHKTLEIHLSQNTTPS